MEPQDPSPAFIGNKLMEFATKFLKFVKAIDKNTEDYRPEKHSPAFELLSHAAASGNSEIIVFAVVEAKRQGVSFKDIEWHARKNNLTYWLITKERKPGETPKSFEGMPIGLSDEQAEYHLIVSNSVGPSIFSHSFGEDPKNYLQNFNRLSKASFLQMKESAPAPAHDPNVLLVPPVSK
jgi:hypothetical protein